MISNPRIIRGRSASDLHFGAAHTPAERIAYGLDRLVTNDAVFKECDLILYPGDITERILPQPSKEAQIARGWMDRNLELAEKHDTVIAVVEGTPMHDWYQSEYFVEANNIRGNKAPLYYVKEVKIVYIEELGIHVLFVPDEANDTCQLTQLAVENALREAGLEQVDITIIHGQFRHQYPEYLRDSGMDFHDSDYYLSITRHFVFAGHVHTHSIYKRIIAQGSFERLHHGYEAPKGCVGFELHLDDPSKSKAWFIENHDAMIYKTFHVKGDDVQWEADRIRLEASKLPSGSYIRIMAKKGHPILTMVKEFKREFQMFRWTSEQEKEKKKTIVEVVTARVKKARISIRPDNVAELLKERLDLVSEQERVEILAVLEKCK